MQTGADVEAVKLDDIVDDCFVTDLVDDFVVDLVDFVADLVDVLVDTFFVELVVGCEERVLEIFTELLDPLHCPKAS